MNPHYIYLLIDIGAVLFPLAASFEKKVAFYKSWRALLPAMLITAAVFIAWDAAFTAQGIWWFNRDYTLPFRLGGLPLEEWLFFLAIPYACAFIHACIGYYFPARWLNDGWTWAIGLAIILILLATLNYLRAYSLSAFGGCGLGLLLAYAARRQAPDFHVGRFLVAYAVCLLPFLIVNGLLTSLPVVLYDDGENTGLRIYTIPVEDVFYGMLLVLGTVWGMCFVQARRSLER